MSHKNPLATTSDWGIVKVGNGIAVSDGIISTAVTPSLNYGFFYDTVNQTNPVANAINQVSWNTQATFNQVILNPPTKLTVLNSGTYTKVFTVSLQKTSPGAPAIASIWLRYSPTIAGPAVDVVESRQDIEVPNQVALLFVTGGYTLDMAANSYVEMCWSCSDIAVQLASLPASVGPIRPATPSAKITLTRIN